MPPDTLGLSFLHKGSPQEGCSVLERQRLPKGLKKVKNMFFRNFPRKNCFQRARIAPAKPGKKGGSGRSSGKRPSARGPPGPPSGQQGGLARTRQGDKVGAYIQFTPPKIMSAQCVSTVFAATGHCLAFICQSDDGQGHFFL